jgi:hypothetical protein
LPDGKVVVAESSGVRINRLKDTFSWSVTVAAEASTEEALREAKARALLILGELEEELRGRKLELPGKAEVPF